MQHLPHAQHPLDEAQPLEAVPAACAAHSNAKGQQLHNNSIISRQHCELTSDMFVAMRCVLCLLRCDQQAAIGRRRAVMQHPAADEEGMKQPLAAGKRVTQAQGLNPENVCKWKALHALYYPDDAEWKLAAAAPRWDSPNISERIRQALDREWALAKWRAKGQEREAAELRERQRKQEERRQKRWKDANPTRQFLKAHNLSIVHEAARPPSPDLLAAEIPFLSTYKNKRKRKSRASTESSPSPDPELEEEAAKRGIAIVSPHKKTRQSQAEHVHEPDRVAAAAQLLSSLTPAQREAALAQAGVGASTSSSSGARASSAASGLAAKPTPSRSAAAEQAAAAIADYYKKKKEQINAAREAMGGGKLNQTGRKNLRTAAKQHYKEGVGEEVGFSGTALQQAWDVHFLDAARYPAADSDELDSDDAASEDETQ